MKHQTEQPDTPEEAPGPRRPSRRMFLGGLGAGAATVIGAPIVAAAHGRGDRDRDARRDAGRQPRGRGNDAPTAAQTADGPDRFSRIFDDHPPFAEADDELREMLTELGRPGGILDADDPLDVGPIRLILEPELSPDNPDNPNQTAGMTFVGQFLDHDITHDAGSTLGRSTSVRRSTNLRTARLDLDSVYGGGPADSPDLYDAADPFLLRVDDGGRFEDLPRDADGVAIIGDARNDENLIVSGLHAAYLKFHNNVLTRLRAAGLEGETAFTEARRLVQWHHQWLVVHEYLPAIVGQPLVDDILTNGPRTVTDGTARIPVEFQTAAFRFGHSQVRPSYRANLAGDDGEAFFAMVFNPDTLTAEAGGDPDPDDLSGGHRAARRFIGWQTFFDFEDGEVRNNKRIDTKLSTPLFQLPLGIISNSRGEPIGPASLATRNLLRHITWGIPSGQAVAEAMGVDRLAAGDLADIDAVAPRLTGDTPLWIYVLREAEVMADGLTLGPVGGRIVAEVFLSLLQLDPDSYLVADPTWRPTLPTRAGGGDFRMVDLLTEAGVDPVSRGE